MLLQQQETARVCRLQSVVGRLAKVHKVFLSQLSEEQSLPTAIAEIFLETSDILDIHDEYRESVIAATDLLSSLPEDTCQMLASAIPSLAEQSMEDVSALFHASFSRLEEYLQCFENTACRTTEESQIVSSACCKIRERLLGLVSQGDWCLPSAENGVRSLNRDVVHISKCVTHLPPYVNIAVPGRVIYKQGLLTKQKLSSHKFSRIAKSKKERMCFLFNDMLIYCAVVSDGLFRFKGLISSEWLSVHDPLPSNATFIISRLDRSVNYLMKARAAAEKREWVDAFTRCSASLRHQDDVSYFGKHSIRHLAVSLFDPSAGIALIKDKTGDKPAEALECAGRDIAEWIVANYCVSRQEATRIGQSLLEMKFLRAPTAPQFFDGSHIYRYLGSALHLNDGDCCTAVADDAYSISIRLLHDALKLLSTTFPNDTGACLDASAYDQFCRSTMQLQHICLTFDSEDKKLAFWLNMYHLLGLHGILQMINEAVEMPCNVVTYMNFFTQSRYSIGGVSVSLLDIGRDLLSCPLIECLFPVAFVPSQMKHDQILHLQIRPYRTMFIDFSLSNFMCSGPRICTYSEENLALQLADTMSQFFESQIKPSPREIMLPWNLKLYLDATGEALDDEFISNLLPHLPLTVSQILQRCRSTPIAFQNFNWSWQQAVGARIPTAGASPCRLLVPRSCLKLLAERLFDRVTGVAVKDRTYHLKTYHSCFTGKEAVDWMVHNFNFTRAESTFIGQQLIELNVFQHVVLEHAFEDKPLFYTYRHDYSLNAHSVWLRESRSAVEVAACLLQRIIAVYNKDTSGSYASLRSLAADAEYQQFCDATAELQNVDLTACSSQELLVFFVNIYNTLSLHGRLHASQKQESKEWGFLDSVRFLKQTAYNIGGSVYSLLVIDHCILRAELNPPEGVLASQFLPKLKPMDPRARFRVFRTPLVNFALTICSQSSPPLRVYSLEDLNGQLVKNASEFLQSVVRVSPGFKKKKILLPKILQWFWKDFGDTEADMLKNIARFLSSDMLVQIRGFEDVASIHYLPYNWSLRHPSAVSSNCCIVSRGLIRKAYTFAGGTTGEQIAVSEELTESKYAFSIPREVLRILIPMRNNEVAEIESSWQERALVGKQMRYVVRCTELYKLYGRGEYDGLSFKPSTYKCDPSLAFVPTNLQVQTLAVLKSPSGAVHEHVTFGAPAAHAHKFKFKDRVAGLKSRLECLHNGPKMDSEHAALQIDVCQRMDMCLSQALAAVVASFTSKLRYAANKELVLSQCYSVGYLVHFESLLSTYGNELGMLEDMVVATAGLSRFCFSLTRTSSAKTPYEHVRLKELQASHVAPSMQLRKASEYSLPCSAPVQTLTSKRYVIKIPVPDEMYKLATECQIRVQSDGSSSCIDKLIPIHPILFTQGINEAQSMAIRLGNTALQEETNQNSIRHLKVYFTAFKTWVSSNSLALTLYPRAMMLRLERQLSELTALVMLSRKEKRFEILVLSADLTR